jgi:hypothetical protein
MSEDQPNYVDRRQWKYDPMTGNRLWQGLTDDEIRAVSHETVSNVTTSEAVMFRAFARAIEAKLKEKNASDL